MPTAPKDIEERVYAAKVRAATVAFATGRSVAHARRSFEVGYVIGMPISMPLVSNTGVSHLAMRAPQRAEQMLEAMRRSRK